MDIAVAPAILNCLSMRLEHPTFGYTDRPIKYREAFASWLNRRYDYKIKAEDILLVTGVMYGISASLMCFTEPGDKVILFEPCYPPLRAMIEKTGREAVLLDMLYIEDRWVYDWDAIGKQDAKAILMCNPHNPTGNVMTKEDCAKLAAICEEHQLKCFIDEIHADFAYKLPFVPVMNASPYMKENTLAYVSVSKTFNLAGLKVAAALTKNKAWHKRLSGYAAMVGIHSINLFALECLEPALYQSDTWFEDTKKLFDENRQRVLAFIAEKHLPIRTFPSEGTYFMWLDFMCNDIHQKLYDKGRILLSDGKDFGTHFSNYQRLVLASDPDTIDLFLKRLEAFFQDEVSSSSRI